MDELNGVYPACTQETLLVRIEGDDLCIPIQLASTCFMVTSADSYIQRDVLSPFLWDHLTLNLVLRDTRWSGVGACGTSFSVVDPLF